MSFDRYPSLLGCLLALLLIASSCSSSGDQDTAAGSDATSCEQSAAQIVGELDSFLAAQDDVTPSEFFERPDVPGLEAFQQDVAEIITGVIGNPNDDCNEFDLEDELEIALDDYDASANGGVLGSYVVGAIRSGLEPEKRDVTVSPNDDLLAVLPLLGPGSSVTFTAGEFTLDATLLVQSDLTIVGAGASETTLRSTAEAAALAVLGGGSLTLSDLSVEHVGDLPASVIIAFDAPVELIGVNVSGAVSDDEGGGGSGLVITSVDDVTELVAADLASVTVANSVIADNDAAGIAVTGPFAPTILGSTIDGNGQCGICYFDTASGQVQQTSFSANAVAIQSSDASTPEIADNDFINNLVAGMLVEGTAAPTVVSNRFDGPEIVGIDVQGTAAPTIQANTFGPHAVALSAREESQPEISLNQVDGGEVALLVGGSAAPVSVGNTFANTTQSAILHTATSAGSFEQNTVNISDGAGVVVEGSAMPQYRLTAISGGIVGAVFSEDAGGLFAESSISGQEVGIEVADNATPSIRSTTFAEISQAGVIFSGAGASQLEANVFDQLASIAIQAGGTAAPEIRDNVVTGGDTGVLILEESTAVLRNNTLTGQNFGVGISGSAMPSITGNVIEQAGAAAISFEGEAAGEVNGNSIIDAQLVGIRVGGEASPLIGANRLFALVPESANTESEADTEEGSGAAAESAAGIIYVESASGDATLNQIFGFVIGMQVSDQASPTLQENRVDGAGVGGVGILYGGAATGVAAGNISANQQIGVQVTDTAGPALNDNVIENAAAAGILIQGEASPNVSGNECIGPAVGIALLEGAAPEIAENDCTVVRQ